MHLTRPSAATNEDVIRNSPANLIPLSCAVANPMVAKLGPYRIERMLGRGGMGTVFAGVHEETGQRAAIKSLTVTLEADDNLRERFLTEIQTLKKLKHPNIVELYGDGEENGQLFYVMELVEGKTLQEELQAGKRFEWPEVVDIAIDVCQALKHAHDRGVIHRDLKPANLLRTPSGQIKLSDFGIAKLFGATHLTAHGSVVGTADYMAPEQAEGNPVTHRTDLYSLGAVLFTLLARRPPFVGPNLPQMFHKLRYEEAPPVRRFAPQTPVELDLIIQQLLKKEPSQRIPTALALANRLRAMQHALLRSDEDFEIAVSLLGDESPHEDPTRIVEEPGSATAVAPTAVIPDPGASAANRGAGSEFTLLSVHDPSAASAAPAPANPTVPDPPQIGPDRFSWRNEGAADSAGEQPRRTASYLTMGGLAAAILTIVGFVIWAARPPSADALHARILSISQDSEPGKAAYEIEEFLRRFPTDPRATEVEALRMDSECASLQRRLAFRALMSGGSKLEPYEHQLLDAMRQRPEAPVADPQGLRQYQEALRAFLAEYGQPEDPSPPLDAYLAAARHLLTRSEAGEP